MRIVCKGLHNLHTTPVNPVLSTPFKIIDLFVYNFKNTRWQGPISINKNKSNGPWKKIPNMTYLEYIFSDGILDWQKRRDKGQALQVNLGKKTPQTTKLSDLPRRSGMKLACLAGRFRGKAGLARMSPTGRAKPAWFRYQKKS